MTEVLCSISPLSVCFDFVFFSLGLSLHMFGVDEERERESEKERDVWRQVSSSGLFWCNNLEYLFCALSWKVLQSSLEFFVLLKRKKKLQLKWFIRTAVAAPKGMLSFASHFLSISAARNHVFTRLSPWRISSFHTKQNSLQEIQKWSLFFYCFVFWQFCLYEVFKREKKSFSCLLFTSSYSSKIFPRSSLIPQHMNSCSNFIRCLLLKIQVKKLRPSVQKEFFFHCCCV